MNLIRYVLFFGIILFIGYYIKTNMLDKSTAMQTPGFLIDQEQENMTNEPSDQNQALIDDLNKDLLQSNLDRVAIDQLHGNLDQAREQKGGDFIPSSCCLPGSPGANEYNYGKNAGGRCGPVTTFDPNGLGKTENFRKSTPEVINGRTQNWIPPHLISQLHYVGPFEETVVQASNQNVVESTCNFVSEKTNLAQYFKANPDLYLATDRYSTFKPFVPFTCAWKEQSDCFNNIKYADDRSIPGNFVVNKVS